MNPLDPTIKTLIEGMMSWVSSIAPQLWDMALKQVRVRAIQDGALAVIFLLIIVIWLLTHRRILNVLTNSDSDLDSDVEGGFWTMYIITWIIMAIFFIIALSNIWNVIFLLVNPQYAALQMLIDLVRNNTIR